ncbi:MAG: fibronectin type III domain-containing protein [Prevotella sp.]|nr:fibronectin type III domain-containing protein [Prevotella sp.]
MKKKFLLIMAGISWLISAGAQPIQMYDLEVKQGSYQELTGGTSLGSLAGVDYSKYIFDANGNQVTESGYIQGLPIGFDFVYNNQKMNRFVVYAAGIVKLGRDSVNIPNPNANSYLILSNKEEENAFGCVPNMPSYSGDENVAVTYHLTGEAPNRTLTVQWKNHRMNSSYWDEQYVTVDMQIKLNEGKNTIEFCFKNWNPNDEGISKWAHAGLKGSDKDILNLSENWDDPTISSDATANFPYNVESFPADGLTYRFTAPADCETPKAQPTGLTADPKSTSIEGSFTPSASADHYLTLLSTEAELNELPQDGILYARGDSIGKALVVALDTATTFTTAKLVELEGSTPYYIHVFSANTFCSFGPKYLTENPLTAATRTLAALPDSFQVESQELTEAIVSIGANAKGNQVVIGCTRKVAYNDWDQMMDYGVFAQPGDNPKVGDAIDADAKVVYVGEAKEHITISGLDENTIYFFRAWSLGEDGKVSSTYLDDVISTGSQLPFRVDLSQHPAYMPLLGWGTQGQFQTYLNQATDERYIWCLPGESDENGNITAWLETPEVKMGSGLHHLLAQVNFNRPKGWMGRDPYNDWGEGEELRIQYTTNGSDYQDIEVIDRSNNPQLADATSYEAINVPFMAEENSFVKFRFYWNCRTANVYLQLKDLLIEDTEELAAPTNITVTPADTSAIVSWESAAAGHIVAYKAVSDTRWSTTKVEGKEWTVDGLTPNTAYELKLKSAENDSLHSLWSETRVFTTTNEEVCETPSDLTVTAVSATAATLSWTADARNLRWNLRYRKGSDTSWTEVKGLEETTCTLTGLEPDASYVWSVMAECAANESEWAKQKKFNTELATAISKASLGEMEIFVKGGMLNVVNSDNGHIQSICIYNEAGQLLKKCHVNSEENVFIPVSNHQGTLLIKIVGADSEKVVKLMNP